MLSTSKMLVLLTGGLIVCVAALMFIAGFFYPGGFTALGITPESTYSYDVSIDASSEISGVTFFLPLPAYMERSTTGENIKAEGYGFGNGIKSELLGAKDALALKVSADTLKESHFGNIAESKTLIDTLNPAENSEILRPVMDLTDEQGNTEYETYVYAKYDADPDCTVKITINSSGRNEWTFLSPQSNSFTNTVEITLTGPQAGWNTARAKIDSGNGDHIITM
ncbi:hypothetical protein J2128_002510 [Methanomicrobium sp. W14]|jgi:hypothetical protein|uniref:hypothetical protein n=1 Tax=Methanomicrobium sp. W14 TaxID=2817839 RepID=UPI001AE25726|nr:hypothetical protein [Methanomicrobium sp. W14]MBP2134539.1 hypothetical protein [Methanomicrobium sp. W14]